MRLEMSIMAGEESKKFLMDLSKLVARMEAAAGKKGAAAPETEAEEEETEAEEEEEDFAPKKTKGKSKSFDDDETEEEEAELSSDDGESFEEEEAEEEEAPKKKKLTINDVNDACKLRAKRVGGKDGRKQVLDILKKKFKTTTVSEIDEKLWPKVIAAMRE